MTMTEYLSCAATAKLSVREQCRLANGPLQAVPRPVQEDEHSDAKRLVDILSMVDAAPSPTADSVRLVGQS